MHGQSPGFPLLVNTEVDSMGGVVDGGVCVDSKTSPRHAAIEKAQAELRQEYDAREQRRRELEFLEKGGNPLDFKSGHVASLSVQSTSFTDQLAEHEPKATFAITTSPHGGSVESSGRPSTSWGREPNTADNLLLFDGENSFIDGERNGMHSRKRNDTGPSEQSSHMDGNHSKKDSEESAMFRLGVKRQAYARRNRSRTNRDSTHVGSVDIVRFGQLNGSSILLSSRPNTRDVKGPLLESHGEDQTAFPSCSSKPASPYGNNINKILASNDHLDAVLVCGTSPNTLRVEVEDGRTDITTVKNIEDTYGNDQNSQAVSEQGPNGTISSSSDLIGKGEETLSKTVACVPCQTAENKEDFIEYSGVNGLRCVNDLQNEDPISGKCIADTAPQVLPSVDMKRETSHVSASCRMDGSAANEHCLMLKESHNTSDGDSNRQITAYVEVLMPDANGAKETNDLATVGLHPSGSYVPKSIHQHNGNIALQVKAEEVLGDGKIDMRGEVRLLTNNGGSGPSNDFSAKTEKKLDKCENFISDNKVLHAPTTMSNCLVTPNHEPLNAARRGSTCTSDIQNFTGNHRLAKKAHEDAILKEARIIEAKRKRAGELSMINFCSEKQRKSHWDFVLEEMAWLANDFMQERLWKSTAAAQICNYIASSGRLNFEKENLCRKQRTIAWTLAKAIMNFWHSAEVLRTGGDATAGTHIICKSALSGSWRVNASDAGKDQDGNHLGKENSRYTLPLPIQGYAFRFLKFNSSSDHHVFPEAPTTPDRIADAGILEISCKDQSLERSLFYTVPVGAMQVYRESVESECVQYDEKMRSTIHQEDCEVSMYDTVADNTFEEDEDETSTYYLPGTFGGCRSSKFAHKKRKTSEPRSGPMRSYAGGCGMPYGSSLENKLGSHPSLLTGKRPSSNLNIGSIPTKRIRTAARQRVASPFNAGNTGGIQMTSKTDNSSGDTNSFQDDQSSLQCGSQSRKNSEVESTVDFEKQLPFDGAELSVKSKKKKKPKHLGYKNSLNSADSGAFIMSGKGSSYDQRWQVNSINQHEQKEHSKKRLESHHLYSNGTTGLYGQHAAKRPKILKQLTETSPEAIAPVPGSISSPVASQMSNMSNPNKLIKMITSRDRGRKNKALKMASGQSCSGSPWSPFEDQALVVLVHDMGPNWELVSDVINSTLQFKCIFRRPKECKERHKTLIDRNSGDGADSAEDSGSSQPYPSTLPGIPKGSARQLFQCLQGPMEEDALKAHFEKIILIGRHLHSHRSQNHSQELKQIDPAHRSHGVSLSQACPNNLSGVSLTPLDLCDAYTSGPDVLTPGYQGPDTNVLAIPNHQVSAAPVLSTSAANSTLQGSPGMVIGNTLSSPSASLNAPTRESPRYCAPRATSLPVDDQQRMQQYSQMLAGRSIQQSSMPISGALPVGTDRGVRILPGGNGMGMMCGMNRNMPLPRPGFQGIGSPGMLNMVSSGNMLSSSGIGMPSPVHIHPTTVSGPGNSMLRPRDALQILRPGHNTEDHRQMMMQEFQLQVTQGNGQAIAPFSSMSATFPNQSLPSPPVQSFPVQQHQQPHQVPQQPHVLGNHHHPQIQGTNHGSPQQQAYAMRLAKERNHHQLQQRLLQQQLSGSHGMSSVQSSPQVQQQTQSSSSSSLTQVPSSQTPHKQGSMSHNLQAGSGLPNQMMKQRQRQQLSQQQQQSRQQQQQRQGKLMKGVGRGGSMLMHQNLATDASHVNGGMSAVPGSQVPEKHLIQQSQGLFSGGSGSNLAISQPSSQQKMYSRPLSQSPKQMLPISSHPDTFSQSQIQVPTSHMLASQQPPVPSSLPLASQLPQQLPQRQTSQSHQTMQRMLLHQNRQMSTDGQIQSSPVDQVQVIQPIPMVPIPQDTGGAVPVVTSSPLSASQWKTDISYDTSTPVPSSHMANSPHSNSVGAEQAVLPASQGLVQRQLSGSLPINGHGMGEQWQQQKQTPSQQQMPPQPPHQQQHRQSGQGTLHARPANSGPG